MDEGAFRGLMAAVRKEGFSETQLDVIRQAATRNFFRVGQLKALIDLLSYSATKLSALEIGAPRVVNPENAYAFYDAFTLQRRQGTGQADPPSQRLLSRESTALGRRRPQVLR